jgi:hypothetical protein
MTRTGQDGRAKLCVLLIALTPMVSVPASAAIGYQVGAAANYSDNVTRDSAGDLDDVVSNLNASAMWSNESPRLAAQAFAQISYLRYFDETFDDEAVPRGDINIDWNIIPARLSWILEDRFGQIASDPFSAFTPDSIENTNIVRTGPDLIFGSSSSQLLTLSIRAEDQYYENQPIDNQRLNSTLQLKRRLSESQSLALNVYGETVEFDTGSVGTDYKLYEAYLSFERLLSHYSFALDAGGTELEIDDESVDGLLGRLTASRSFDTSWFVQLSGEYSYTDSGSRFLIGREQSSTGPGQTVDDENLIAASSPLRLRLLNFSVAHQTARQNLGLELFWESERFELETQLDREQTGGALSYEFSINPLNVLFLSTAYKEVAFDTGNRSDENLEIELRYRRNLTNNLSLDFRVARARRSSSDLAAEYEENVVGLNLSYESDILKALQRRTR